MNRITVRGKGRKVYLTGHAYVCCGGRSVGERVFCTGCHGDKDNRDMDRNKCGPLAVIDRLAAYEDAMTLERAQELAHAEKAGRLVVLPAKRGDTVYIIRDHKIIITIVETIHQWISGKWILNVHTDKKYRNWVGYEVSFNDFGKTVFLTCEEAEEALKKREADNETD